LDVALLELGVFGALVSIEEVAMGFQKIELFYIRIIMPNETFNPLNRWVKHEHQFPNIGLLAC
jgi:hypothetical protein